MAITITAPRTSTRANANKNILRASGTLLPNSDNTPKEKAISVAIGIPQPAIAFGFLFTIRNKTAGIIIPPIAADIGKAACLNDDNSPAINSRFISKPATKKPKSIERCVSQK